MVDMLFGVGLIALGLGFWLGTLVKAESIRTGKEEAWESGRREALNPYSWESNGSDNNPYKERKK